MEVRWSKSAERDLHSLTPDQQTRLKKSLHKLAATGLGDVEPIRTQPGLSRLKLSGSFPRVILRFSSDVIEVVRILPRSRSY